MYVVNYLCKAKSPKLLSHANISTIIKIPSLLTLKNILKFSSSDNNPDVLWEDFKIRFLSVPDCYAPQITRKVKNEHSPWMTHNIKKLIYHRDFLKKKAVKIGFEYMFVAYKKARNQLNNLIRDTKSNYTNLINKTKNNPKDMWNTINRLTNKKSKTTKITKKLY